LLVVLQITMIKYLIVQHKKSEFLGLKLNLVIVVLISHKQSGLADTSEDAS